MRDLFVTAIMFGSIPFILRRPWIGAMMWIWVSIMSPHRLTWSYAYSMPFAQIIALATFAAILLQGVRNKFPWSAVTVTLVFMMLWMCITTLFAIHPEYAVPQWAKVMKIQVMNLVVLYLLHDKRHILAMVWVTTLSMAFYGLKGGVFTILGGGENRVYGPPGSFVEENNQLALATIMIIPLLYFLSTQMKALWQRAAFWGGMVLCGFSVLGSQSRGGLLAVAAMVAFLWMKARAKFRILFVLVLLAPAMVMFMPEKWFARMESIQNYQQDSSAMGRINAWMMALNLVKDRPIVGGGFELYSKYTFGRWAPDPTDIHSSHSNYFQMLGEHGWPGLILFLLVLFFAWRAASDVIRRTKYNKDLQWARDLCAMVQVSLVGYSVGGAFVNLGYFDLVYFLIGMVVLTRVYVYKALNVDAPRVADPRGKAYIAKPGQQNPRDLRPGLGVPHR